MILIKNFNPVNGMNNHYYDILNGISGIGIYFCDYPNRYKDHIQEIAQWLISIINHKNVNDILGLTIYPNQINNVEFKQYEEGYIDFGVAHGIFGICYFLYLARDFVNITKDIDKVLKKTVDLFLKNLPDESCIKFPLVHYFDNGNLTPWYSTRYSWCYGLLGAMRIMYLVAKDLKMNTALSKIENKIIEISNMELNQLNLICPTFCHGYSSVYLIYKFYEQEGIKINKNFIKQLETKIWSFANKNNKFYFNKYDYLPKQDKMVIQDNNLSFLSGTCSILYSYIISENLNANFCDFFSNVVCIKGKENDNE